MPIKNGRPREQSMRPVSEAWWRAFDRNMLRARCNVSTYQPHGNPLDFNTFVNVEKGKQRWKEAKGSKQKNGKEKKYLIRFQGFDGIMALQYYHPHSPMPIWCLHWHNWSAVFRRSIMVSVFSTLRTRMSTFRCICS